MSRTTSRTLPVRAACHRVGHLQCFMRGNRFLQTTHVSKHRDTSVADSAVPSDPSQMHLTHSRIPYYIVFGKLSRTLRESRLITIYFFRNTLPVLMLVTRCTDGRAATGSRVRSRAEMACSNAWSTAFVSSTTPALSIRKYPTSSVLL